MGLTGADLGFLSLPVVHNPSLAPIRSKEDASVQLTLQHRASLPSPSINSTSVAGLAFGALVVARAFKRRGGAHQGSKNLVCVAATESGNVGVLDKAEELSPIGVLEKYVKDNGGSKVIRRVLIANNGMAATKAILSMRQWAYLELGLDSVFEFVVMATPEDLDANAEFIRLADTYVEVPGGKNVNNYANVELICATAKAYDVDAVWPGWGHASENPKLPDGLSKLGITFIGPTSPVMSVLGDKIAANILAQTAGVPSIPWSGDGLTANLTAEGTIPDDTFQKGTINSVEEAIACAERIGYPVMLKASEGGGGKGIRMSYSQEELEANYPQVIAEVPGSPVFMMQLCKGARHIEVQIVGDMHGNAVALNGRDCSTQRRFQKIFEEGPPSIVPKETFKEMERAAQRLTQNIGYIGAGTVEYLYNAQSNEFYFLELNPRLQVEHPVTEELTQVNLPATQLQVLMGIPLEKIPQIRRFYGKDLDDTSGIDFLTDDYVYPSQHVIAARITAENPDDGFKPTSGRIQRIKFQSSVSCWGYFSVGANGGIHEFADSQFGHIFAHGATREDARKALMLSLKNINVVGEIRNPVEYLVELAGTDAFRDNTIDTSWLDGLIKEKSVAVKYNSFDVVFYAAVFRAMETLKASESEILDALGKSQLVPLYSIGSTNTFPIEITFDGKKFEFQVARNGPDMLSLTIGGQQIQAKVRTQPDGAIFVSVGNSVMKFSGTEEPLGLRLRLENVATIMVPTIYDPSELRSEFNGKIVRYLQDNGAPVRAGQAYVELEAMKMIMPVKASASGKVTHTRGVGSIVSAGDLLASLELEDASSVQKIVPFEGEFALTTDVTATAESDLRESLQQQISCVLDGYTPASAPSELVQALFAAVEKDDYSNVATTFLEQYLAVEEQFAQISGDKAISADQVYQALIASNKDDLKKVASLALAHSQLGSRKEIVLSILRDLRLDPRTLSSELEACLNRLAALPSSSGNGEVMLVARQVLEKVSSVPFKDRCQTLRSILQAPAVDFNSICTFPAKEGGVELLGELLGDDSSAIRKNALEAFVRRTYRSSDIPEIKVSDEGPSKLTCEWKFNYPGVQEEGAPLRQGLAVVVPKFEDVETVLGSDIPLDVASSGELTNSLQIIIGPQAFSKIKDDEGFYGSDEELQTVMVPKLEALLKNTDNTLRAKGVNKFVVTLLQGPNVPRYVCFLAESGWCEDTSRRDMHPSLPHLLEINVLTDNYDLKRIVPTIGRNSQVYVGTMRGAKAGKRGPPRTVFVRMITHTMKAKVGEESWTVWPETLLLSALDEIERARLNPDIGMSPSSQIYAHFMWLVDAQPNEASESFKSFMNQFVSKHGLRLQQMKVDEIILKAGIGSESTGRTSTLRLTASSMTGEYLRMTCLLEKEDPLTLRPIEFKDAQTGELYDAQQTSQLGMRRSIARAVGSTYAPEFLGMMKMELISRWNAYTQQQKDAGMPSNVFESKELVLMADGTLTESDRSPGENNIGMVAWRCTMQTPEYPQGRDIILIANDVTYQAGSFGVAEDVFFQKASEYARKRGLPRVYIACNSGARVGLVEELKPHIKAAWKDSEDPSKGFDYLYLEEADYKRFDEGTVLAREVQAADGTRYAIEAIIGEGQKSTAGGIGVENLQGSGLIAGETSRAYNEVFTLSYVTGRSVGIGAYLNRLGQRTIQMAQGPMILTGFGALNKLLGRAVYTSQDQLGGPQVMVPNGVTHQLVQNDQEGVCAILDWLSYIPKDTWSVPPMIAPMDPVERDITFIPSKRPYDPRHMLAGTTTPQGQTLTGFFDEGSFKEYLEGWGKSVVVGRAKLGGIPMGVIAVETRGMERRVPADPANPDSQEVIEPQAGQVWFPDSAFKTATAIRDFNRGENLPLIVFANWRGFSGGTRDMYSEVLKFGAQIVDALVDYKNPVFMYIPPGGELRGGAWVVIDPAINPEQMEMYADVDSRGGILEPAGIVEVKFREGQQKELMHKLDPQLKELDEALHIDASVEVASSVTEIQAKIKAREEKLLPLYTQIACEFADLHDRTGRMQAKGVIRGALKWPRSREFFYWRVRRRLMEQDTIVRICSADPELSAGQAKEILHGWLQGDDDRSVVAYLEKESLNQQVESVRVAALKRQIKELTEALPEAERASLL